MLNKVSIIVPIYNVEKYLVKCIESLINQSYKNLEIILVNDGSSDNSEKICKQYSKIDKRVKLYNKKNGGVSSTRNYGLKMCTGDFITFVDSDDFVNADFINNLISYQKKGNYDIVISNAKDIINNEVVEKNFEYLPMTLSKENTIKEFLKSTYFSPVCWGRLYKRQVLNNLFFDESMSIAEDGKFFLQAIENSKCNIVIPEKNYFYLVRNGSLIHSNYNKKWLSEVKFAEECLAKYKNTYAEKDAIFKFIEINIRLIFMKNSEKGEGE